MPGEHERLGRPDSAAEAPGSDGPAARWFEPGQIPEAGQAVRIGRSRRRGSPSRFRATSPGSTATARSGDAVMMDLDAIGRHPRVDEPTTGAIERLGMRELMSQIAHVPCSFNQSCGLSVRTVGRQESVTARWRAGREVALAAPHVHPTSESSKKHGRSRDGTSFYSLAHPRAQPPLAVAVDPTSSPCGLLGRGGSRCRGRCAPRRDGLSDRLIGHAARGRLRGGDRLRQQAFNPHRGQSGHQEHGRQPQTRGHARGGTGRSG